MLRDKFSNESLYSGWRVLCALFTSNCFQADYEVAKRAERCWSFERGTDASFIKFGAWDSSMRGLLSGERLYLQLKEMEQAFLEHQIRDFEITKNISLVRWIDSR